ncbi:hypothetical protein JCM3766R1_003890 [Sporobolomyces carnicolor]
MSVEILLSKQEVLTPEAQDAGRLLEMRSAHAEAWIKAKLPPPPDPESLTRFNPLPPRPSPEPVQDKAAQDSSSFPAVFQMPREPSSTLSRRPTVQTKTPIRSILKKRTTESPASRPASPPRHREGRTPQRAAVSGPHPLRAPPSLALDRNGKPVFAPSQLCRLAIHRLPLDNVERVLASSGVSSISNVSVVRAAVAPTTAPMGKEGGGGEGVGGPVRSIAFCTVATVDDMKRLVEWGDGLDYFVERAAPSNPHAKAYYHVVVRGLDGDVDMGSFKRMLRQTRCGSFEHRIGHVAGDSRQVVGVARVGTIAGAQEAVAAFAARATTKLVATWGHGHGPSLFPIRDRDDNSEEQRRLSSSTVLPQVVVVKKERGSAPSQVLAKRGRQGERDDRRSKLARVGRVNEVPTGSVPVLPFPLPPLPRSEAPPLLLGALPPLPSPGRGIESR